MSSCTTPTGNASPCSSQNARRQSLFCAIRSDSSQRKRVTCVRRRGRENVRLRKAAGRWPELSKRWMFPVAKSDPVRSSDATRWATASGGTRSSESTNMSSSPPARATPALRAAPSPAFSCRTSTNRGSSSATLAAIAAERVGRAVVDHHHLEIGERLRAQRREALRQVGLDAVDRHDDADPRHRPYRGRPRGASRSQPPRPRLPPPAPPRGPGDRAAPRGAGRGPPAPARAAAARPPARDPDPPPQRLRARRHRPHDDEPRGRARAAPRGGDRQRPPPRREAVLPPPARRHRLRARRPRRARRRRSSASCAGSPRC